MKARATRVQLTDSEAQAFGEHAERMDALFEHAREGLPYCPIHLENVVYLDGGCQACAYAKAREVDAQRRARYARKLCRRRKR